jgi:uncharacterized protein
MNLSREVGYALFRIIIPLLVLLIQYILFRKTERWFATNAPNARSLRNTLRVLFIVFNVAYVATYMYLYYIRPGIGWPVPAPEFVRFGWYPFFLWHGGCFFVGMILLISKIVKSPFHFGLWLARKIGPARSTISRIESHPTFQVFDSSRRQFIQRGMYGLTALSFGGTAYGMLLEKNLCDVTNAEFFLPTLPPAFDGLTIALASDIHSSLYMSRDDMSKYAELINGLHADVIVVPGDFVTSNYNEAHPFAESFSILRAPMGVYGVLGNHDFYAGPDHVARIVDDCGIKLLRDDHIMLSRNGAQIALLGVDDVGTNNRAPIKLEVANGQLTSDMTRILLCHRPYYLKDAAEKKIDLVLSGHTHGGQVVFGRFGDVVLAPARFASPYIWGKYQEGTTQMYVSRGIGTVGLPVRINCPPEITRITLRRQNA